MAVRVITADQITWWVERTARAEIERDIVADVGRDAYLNVLVPAFREVVAAYVNVEDRCAGQQGNTVRPVGGTSVGGKLVKVRLGVPGRGKSGSLRVIASLHCEERRCHVLLARWRRDVAGNEEPLAAARDRSPE